MNRAKRLLVSAIADEGICRLISDLGGGLLVRIGDRDEPAQLSGRFRHAVQTGESPKPAVGDFLAYSWLRDQNRAQITGVEPRKTAIKRKSAGDHAVFVRGRIIPWPQNATSICSTKSRTSGYARDRSAR